MVTYVPRRGDIIWLNFDPQSGKEIKKVRPALVVSPSLYNKKTHLALVMPITSQVKNYPFEVALNPFVQEIQGVILADHLKSIDWKARQAKKIAVAPPTVIQEALEKCLLLLDNVSDDSD